MESTSQTPWSRKRKLQTKMERMREAKSTTLHTSPSAGGDSVSPAPSTSERLSESSDVAHVSHEGISITHEQPVLSGSLDESLQVPVNAELSDHGSSESSDDDSGFTNSKCRQIESINKCIHNHYSHDFYIMLWLFLKPLLVLRMRLACFLVSMKRLFEHGGETSTVTEVDSLNQSKEGILVDFF